MMSPDMQSESTAPRREPPRKGGGAWTAVRRFLPAGAAGLALAATLAINEHLRKGAMLLPASIRLWAVLLLVLVPAALAAGWWLRKPVSRTARLWAALPAALLMAGAVVFLFSGATLHPWTYFLGWLPHTGDGWAVLRAGAPLFILLTAALTPFLLKPVRRMDRVMWGVLIAAQIACLVMLLRTTGGAALYKDDHPSFLFRFWEYSRTFPQLLNYNPWWNGGAVNAYCHSSGTGALGLLLLPLWRLFAVHEVYTPGLGLAYIVIMPLVAALSLRIMGASRTAAAIAGLLALGVSRHFFLWVLHYGTACAPMVASFTLPIAACLYRVLWLDRREKWLGVVLVASAAMLLQWPPGGLMAMPILLSFLLAWRKWTWPKFRFLLACAGIVLALTFRHLLVILLKAGTVVDHVMDGGGGLEGVGWVAGFFKGFHFLVAHLQEGHPVILFLGLAGLVALSARGVRSWFGPALLAFALIVGWGEQLKPQLELGRMAIPMMFLAVGPAAVAAGRLLRGSEWRLAPARAALLALLFLGAWNVAKLYGNQGHAGYKIMPQAIPDFAARLREEVPQGGRVMFAGPTVHYFGRGHVAYLPVMAGREMMAVDYYHFPPTYVRYEYPPDGFNHSAEAVQKFVRLYNVTHVVTYHDRWKSFFRSQPEACEELEGFEAVRASVFRMRREPSIFVQGSGRVVADFSRLDVEVADPQAEAVIGYNWVEGLSVPEPVELFPWDAGGGVQLIGIRPNGTAEFAIRYRNWL